MPAERSPAPPSLPALVAELRELVVAYAKQETVEPFKQLGRWVALGIAGSVLLAIGVVFLTLGGLRALQTETGDTFDGNLTWVPYGIVFIAMFAGGLLAVGAASRGRRRS